MKSIPVSRLVVPLLLLGGCGPDAKTSDPKTSPAKIESVPGKAGVSKVTLTQKAYERLQIGPGLVAVGQQVEARSKTYGGEVIVPPGKTVAVSAPMSGMIAIPEEEKALPLPGSQVKRGDALLLFTPILPPEAKATLLTLKLDAERQVESAKVALKMAELALGRAKRLSEGRAASAKIVEEAQAARDLASEAKTTAEQRGKLLKKLVAEADSGELTSLEIKSPVDGILQRLEVSPGETVAAGKVLFEVIKTDRVWIRLPVYVGDARQIDTKKDATVRLLGPRRQATELGASYVVKPPLIADRLAGSTDLYYTMPNLTNQSLPLRPGEIVSVDVTLHSAERLLVPWSAVVYDVHGGTWVYAQAKDDRFTFQRQSVDIEYVNEQSQAVLTSGPEPGTKIVTAGAAELLGTEFGVGK